MKFLGLRAVMARFIVVLLWVDSGYIAVPVLSTNSCQNDQIFCCIKDVPLLVDEISN